MQAMQRLLEIMKQLRDPQHGCPWDLKQDFQSLVPHTLEEAYEVAEAIESGNDAELRDELGDLLFQVVFYAQLGSEQQRFDFEQVATAIADKLVRRHPHVFGDQRIDDAGQQTQAWEAHKAAERQRKSGEDAGALSGVSHTLPSLSRAQKRQRRAQRVGFDWPDVDGVMDKIEEELAECRAELHVGDRKRLQEEVGDLMFACVNFARHLGVDAETALRQANRKFEHRFQAMEQQLRARGIDVEGATLEQMDDAWEAVKRARG